MPKRPALVKDEQRWQEGRQCPATWVVEQLFSTNKAKAYLLPLMV